MRNALSATDKTRSHLHALGTQGKGSHQTATVGDATCSYDGDRYAIDNLGHKSHGSSLADSPARLHALCDNDIGAVTLYAFGRGHAGHHRHDLDAGVPEPADVRSRISASGGHDGDTLTHNHINHTVDEGRRQCDIDAKWTFGLPAREAYLLLNPVGLIVAGADDTQAAGIGDSYDKLARAQMGHAPLDNRISDTQQVADGRFEHQRSSLA
jgi:hypothetical protein